MKETVMSRKSCPQQPRSAPVDSRLWLLLWSQSISDSIFLFSCCLLFFPVLLSFSKNTVFSFGTCICNSHCKDAIKKKEFYYHSHSYVSSIATDLNQSGIAGLFESLHRGENIIVHTFKCNLLRTFS